MIPRKKVVEAARLGLAVVRVPAARLAQAPGTRLASARPTATTMHAVPRLAPTSSAWSESPSSASILLQVGAGGDQVDRLARIGFAGRTEQYDSATDAEVFELG